MDIRFRLLGSAEIAVGDRTVALPPNKPCVVLATLLLRSNQFVPADRLYQAVWGESPPAAARGTLQTYVLRLRQLLAKYSVTTCPIRTVPGGYAVEATEDTLDVLRFRALARAARRCAESGDLAAEARLLAEALALWGGPALTNVPSDLLHRDEAPRLEEERLELVERRIDVEMALGRHRELIPELRSLTATHPQRERFAEHLMTALHRCGRRSEALEEFRRVRATLVDELGVDPGAGLRRLELAVLRGDPVDPAVRSGPVAPGPVRPPVAPADRSPAIAHRSIEMPLPTPDFVGRAAVCDEIAAHLVAPASADGSHRAVATISGPPGVGKTALAIRVAHRVRASFPDGQCHLRLTAPDGVAREPAELLVELLRTLGADPDPAATQVPELAATFRSAIEGRRMLLLLDAAAGVEQVQPLLPGASGSAVLVTSRRSLAGLVVLWGIPSHRLDVLAPAESLHLLGCLLGEQRVAGQRAAAVELAELCGHLPLALRIAATKLLHRPDRDLSGFTQWLRTGTLAKLSIGGSPALSLRAEYEACYRELTEPARRLLRFAGARGDGELTVACVTEQLRLPELVVEDTLDQLFDASLLRERAPGRFGLAGPLRVFAAEKALESADQPARPGLIEPFPIGG